MLEDVLIDLKEWLCYPQEFRINTRKYLVLAESLAALNDVLERASRNPVVENKDEFLDMAMEVGTLVWRAQRILSGMNEQSKELRRVSRDLESVRDVLFQRGVEIKDHTGQVYISGMALRVITFQPMVGLAHQKIIETLKPTIYFRNKVIQMGDVIVGVPDSATKIN